jgi:hypothetical protein
MKGLTVDVYRHGSYDCTNRGITSKVDSILLIDNKLDGGLYEPKKDEVYLTLVRRTLSGREYIHAVPMVNGERLEFGRSIMFGGNYVFCSDSRVRALNDYPIPVHDRFE